MKNTLLIAFILFLSVHCFAQSSTDVATRNKATFIKVNAAYNEKKLDEATQYYAMNFVRKNETGGAGRAGVKARWEETYKTWPDNKAIIQTILAEGDWVMVYCKASATHTNEVMGVKPTNKKIEADFWETIHFDKDGLIVESWSTLDNFAMMKQLGLLPTPKSTPSVNSDEEAIKTVIIDETSYWIDGNFDKWSEGFIHEPYLTWSVTNGSEPGDVLTMRGWEALKTFMAGWFKNYNGDFAKKMKQSEVTRDNWQIQIRSNVAYVSFNQHTFNANTKQVLDLTETRVLEKINGQWKMTMLTALADFKDATPPIKSKY